MANEYLNMTELIKDYYDKPVGEYLDRTVTINNVELACDIYRVAPETVLTSAVFTGCTAVDANTQIIIGRDMSVASGSTLIPPYRCKGIIIGDVGTFTNEGTISMTARGASGEGKNIQLTADYMISAVGGAGGVQTNSGNGVAGSSPTASILSCGGGGTGGSYIAITGRGGNGTSFSGGAGSGGQSGGGSTANGSDTGGAGSAAVVSQAGGYDGIASGGVGNPGGPGANHSGTNIPAVSSGTGGLIVLLCNNFNNIGSIIANGVSATEVSINYGSSGGSSGGGCVVVLTRQSVSEGTLNTDGGAAIGGSGHTHAGGAGGAGSAATLIIDDLILQNLPVEFAITDTEHLDNIEPSEAVRFLGLTDDDELYYDIMGKRHSSGSGHIIENEEGTALTKRKILAVTSPITAEDDDTDESTKLGLDTEAVIDFSNLPSRGQRTPDAFEVDINNPQDGQGIVYNGTQQKWVNGAGGTPVGTIIQFFGYTAPNGYLACDGTEYLKADYPALATLLADLDTHYSTTQYVGSDSDHFKVPDLRGEFLRGTGTNGHTNSGNGADVGTHQDATEFPAMITNNTGTQIQMHLPASKSNQYGYLTPSGIDKTYQASFQATLNPSGSTSTQPSQWIVPRPTNTSVLMCIKAI